MVAVRTIEYHPAAVKALRRMDRATSVSIRKKIRQLADDPASLGNNVTALKGQTGLMRLRVGDWRVIYTEEFLVLSILKIAPRGSAYE